MRKAAVVSTIMAVSFVAPLACNVFLSLDRCDSDSDCPTGFACDPEGRFCARSTVPDGNAEDVVTEDAPASDVDAGADVDAMPPSCDPTTPFTSFTLVKGFESTPIISARLVTDETTILYSGLNGCTQESCYDLYLARRDSRVDAFGFGTALTTVNCSRASEYWPTVSADGKLLFFESGRSVDGTCVTDRSRIWSSTRVNTVDEFGAARIDTIFAVDGGGYEGAPYLHPQGHSLYFASSNRGGAGNLDLFVATLDDFGLAQTVANVIPVNTPTDENTPVVSLDERVLYFSRMNPFSPTGDRDIWVARRAAPGDAFGNPEKVAELAASSDELPAWLSDDMCRLYFSSNRDATGDASVLGDYRLWVAERTPN